MACMRSYIGMRSISPLICKKNIYFEKLHGEYPHIDFDRDEVSKAWTKNIETKLKGELTIVHDNNKLVDNKNEKKMKPKYGWFKKIWWKTKDKVSPIPVNPK